MINEKKILAELEEKIRYHDSQELAYDRANRFEAERHRLLADSLRFAIRVIRDEAKDQRKNPTMQSKGGHARAAKLSPARRKAIARKAANKRWRRKR